MNKTGQQHRHKKYQQGNRLKQILQAFTSSITIPHRCLMCDNHDQHRICRHCRGYFSSPRYVCQRCGLPLKHHALYCGICLKYPPAYDEVFSPYLYQSPLSTLITHFKHRGDECIGKGLGEILAETIQLHYRQQHLTLPQKLVAVPLHWRRQWQRGFNQAELLCDEIGTALGIEQCIDVRRIRSVPAQKALSRQQRLKNLQSCFAVTRPLEGESLVIVDDVMTTGATVDALARTLKAAGAGRVSVWALARTPKSR